MSTDPFTTILEECPQWHDHPLLGRLREELAKRAKVQRQAHAAQLDALRTQLAEERDLLRERTRELDEARVDLRMEREKAERLEGEWDALVELKAERDELEFELHRALGGLMCDRCGCWSSKDDPAEWGGFECDLCPQCLQDVGPASPDHIKAIQARANGWLCLGAGNKYAGEDPFQICPTCRAELPEPVRKSEWEELVSERDSLRVQLDGANERAQMMFEAKEKLRKECADLRTELRSDARLVCLMETDKKRLQARVAELEGHLQRVTGTVPVDLEPVPFVTIEPREGQIRRRLRFTNPETGETVYEVDAKDCQVLQTSCEVETIEIVEPADPDDMVTITPENRSGAIYYCFGDEEIAAHAAQLDALRTELAEERDLLRERTRELDEARVDLRMEREKAAKLQVALDAASETCRGVSRERDQLRQDLQEANEKLNAVYQRLSGVPPAPNLAREPVYWDSDLEVNIAAAHPGQVLEYEDGSGIHIAPGADSKMIRWDSALNAYVFDDETAGETAESDI